ncbi:MAG: ATP-binding protein [Anaerolineae bacterium]
MRWIERQPLERLTWLRWLLPFAIFLLVLSHQTVAVLYGPSWSPAFHFATNTLFYGLVGPAVTWVILTWIARQLVEKEEAEEKAREHERFLATVTAHSADAIISLDNNGIIQSWNRGAELIFGYRPAEIVGQHFSILVPAESKRNGELELIARRIAEKGFIKNYETDRITKDGRRVTVELTRTLLTDKESNIIGSSAILRDITAKKRAEEKIRHLNKILESKVAHRTRELLLAYGELRARNEELEKANEELKELDRLKSEFVSMVSHELRAPLTNVSGALELIKGGCDHPSFTCQEMFRIVSDQTTRLTRLVQGILNVSRIEAGKLHLERQRVDILPIISKVVDSISPTTTVHQFQLPARDGLPPVWGDRDRIEEILLNVVDNAVKYSPEGGTIVIEVKQQDSRIAVSVTDSGIGIPPNELGKIFDKFYRVDSGDAQETYGHGLGLYISKKLVEAHGGQMWVESIVSQGSKFTFTLPLAYRRQ